jgi:hypothetical protein
VSTLASAPAEREAERGPRFVRPAGVANTAPFAAIRMVPLVAHGHFLSPLRMRCTVSGLGAAPAALSHDVAEAA